MRRRNVTCYNKQPSQSKQSIINLSFNMLSHHIGMGSNLIYFLIERSSLSIKKSLTQKQLRYSKSAHSSETFRDENCVLMWSKHSNYDIHSVASTGGWGEREKEAVEVCGWDIYHNTTRWCRCMRCAVQVNLLNGILWFLFFFFIRMRCSKRKSIITPMQRACQ